jgi:hypothetical protein
VRERCAVWGTRGMYALEIYAHVRFLSRERAWRAGARGVWAGSEDGKQHAGVFVAARVSAAEAGEASRLESHIRSHHCGEFKVFDARRSGSDPKVPRQMAGMVAPVLRIR